MQIARAGYDVGFGSKKHFATYDLIEKAPGWLALISLAGGIWALFVPAMESKHLAALFILFAFITFYINQYTPEKDLYRDRGVALIKIYHQLGALAATTSAKPDAADCQQEFNEANALRDEAISMSLSKQIFASDWYAHLKFFGQTQHDWVDAQLHFKFWKDKVPAGLYAFVIALILALAGIGIYRGVCLP